jgi:NADH-quinone oxidoreductase subunit A
MLAYDDYTTVAILILVVTVLTGVMLLLAHLIGPRRHGPVKDSTYESGMPPFTDARRRFHVQFYLVAVLYIVFGVEIVFLYPWAVVFAQARDGLTEYAAARATGTLERASERATWAGGLAQAGYGPGFLLGAIVLFFALLAVGLVYEWRKGIFRWD